MTELLLPALSAGPPRLRVPSRLGLLGLWVLVASERGDKAGSPPFPPRERLEEGTSWPSPEAGAREVGGDLVSLSPAGERLAKGAAQGLGARPCLIAIPGSRQPVWSVGRRTLKLALWAGRPAWVLIPSLPLTNRGTQSNCPHLPGCHFPHL